MDGSTPDSRVGSGFFSNSHRSGRVESGRVELGRVGSGQEVSNSHGSGGVTHTLSDPT